MTTTFVIIAAIGGYVASIYTWPKIKVFANGAAIEAQRLRDKAKALEAAIRGS